MRWHTFLDKASGDGIEVSVRRDDRISLDPATHVLGGQIDDMRFHTARCNRLEHKEHPGWLCS